MSAVDSSVHAGHWKAGLGKAPHYTPNGIQGLGWTCIACPLDGCDWHVDSPAADPIDPLVLEGQIREHLEGHDLADFLATIQAARDASVAIRDANNRAWDVVQLHRLRATDAGRDPYSDPVGQMLSAALVGSEEHNAVKTEVQQLEAKAAARFLGVRE